MRPGRPAVDMTGQSFGRLSVVGRHGSTSDGRAVWFCKCSCGVEKAIPGTSLRSGHSNSCGCKRADQNRSPEKIAKLTLPGQLAIKRRAFRSYQTGAATRGLLFDLKFKDFKKLIESVCSYCGKSPNPINGVDRLDPFTGYVIENCTPACAVCNRAKFTMSAADFRAWIGRAFYYQRVMT